MELHHFAPSGILPQYALSGILSSLQDGEISAERFRFISTAAAAAADDDDDAVAAVLHT